MSPAVSSTGSPDTRRGSSPPLPDQPRRRVVVRDVRPRIDGGRFPIKRVVGESVHLTADLYADGHDRVSAIVRYRPVGHTEWLESPLHVTNAGQDAWAGSFTVTSMGRWEYRVLAWVDHFTTWREDLAKKAAADVDVESHLAAGALLLRGMIGRRRSQPASAIRATTKLLEDTSLDRGTRVGHGMDDALADAVRQVDPRANATSSELLEIDVDRIRARFSSWYELFPRSLGEPGEHGTLRDVVGQLPRVADMGFDVLYLPPIHPIGRTKRKGRNNAVTAGPDDIGSPWAIGAEEGGHRSVHPQLGTVEDLADLVSTARDDFGIDVALDIAFQCSPDHPWVTEHPEWFRTRPDGSIQYAENPPKKYEDIYPINFETSDPEGLWQALLDVMRFWADQGVRVFRVDNPHTKSFRFWEWAISTLKDEHPDMIFLAEAFTRPRVMEELARRGFNQSYSYFTWREAKWELEEYIRYLVDTEVAEFYRPNFWPNTPDILPSHLQYGGRAMFVQRLLLAATISSSWGIYGPTFELMQNLARPDHDEYLDNEKYQLRDWDLDDPESLAPLISRVNRIRREHRALQDTRNLVLHAAESDQVLCFSKRDAETGDTVLVVISLDTQWRHGTYLHLDMDALGMDGDQWFLVDDRLTDNRFHWRGGDQYVELDPGLPAHVFAVHPQ
ncbi:alpha-1,4-glucan--maltose-1-phosphate maltosyltransferase [Salsipaludibacter albus]|uniref:alpha-1,4-glucan--maltose-1-phosphate maltosyltransferase n=1 Tax=Salsipaludibacter albus TaxID=2849650 RepID=UPI001EE4DE1C